MNRTTDRLPPHSLEIEAAALGAMMLDVGNIHDAATLFPGAEVFYDLRHRVIYTAMRVVAAANRPADPIWLGDALKTFGKLDEVGGIAYVSSLPERCALPSMFEDYARELMGLYRLRRLLTALATATALVWDRGDKPVSQVVDEVEACITNAATEHAVSQAKPIADHIVTLGDKLDNYRRGVGMATGILTGYSYLDKMTGGLHPGETIIIAARPSTGKTSLMMNMVERISVDGKLPVLVFSMEMSGEDVTLRVMCARSKQASFHHVRTGFMSQLDYAKLAEVSKDLVTAPIFIDDTPALRIDELRSRARRLHRKHGIRLIAIDYLQLMRSETRFGENREREVAQISCGLKALARELNVPVLVLAQLNREFDKDGGRAPRLSDLRDSGAIEQDADVVGMLWRKRHKDEDGDESDTVIPVNLHLAKQRNGPTGEVELTFFREQMRFEDRYQGSGKTEKDLLDEV